MPTIAGTTEGLASSSSTVWRCLSNMATLAGMAMLGFVWIGVAMAYAAACVQGWRTLGSWCCWEVLGAGLALFQCAVISLSLHCIHRRYGENLFVVVAFCLSLAIGVGWVWRTCGMTNWPMDARMFRCFLDWLAAGGYSVDNLSRFAWMYDYAHWTRRALPLLYPLRVWCGAEYFACVVQLSQAVLGSISLVLSWRIARLLGGGAAAKWTVLAILSMPGFGMQAVGLNHQVWGMCWFVSGIWLWAEWFHGGMKGLKRCLVLGSLAVVLGPLLKWEGFVWPGYLACGLLIAVGNGLWRRNIRDVFTGVTVLVAIPVAVVSATTSAMEQRIESANPQSINGGQISFIARGWDFQAWGEYSERIEKLDILTPPAEKTIFWAHFLASQAAYNGPTLVGKLFPAKLAKYMLAGYASMAEEILHANGAERTFRIARGMRIGWFVLLYAPLVLWGLWRLANQLDHGQAVLLLVPVALFGGGVMFVGETSPRYAICIQPLLLAAGACGWTLSVGSERDKVSAFRWRYFLGGMGIALVGYATLACLLIGLHGMWVQCALADMRTAMMEGGHPSEEPFQAPFEAVFPGGGGTVTWSGKGGRATMYLRGQFWRERVRAEIATRSGEWRVVELPMRMEARWGENEARQLAIHRTEGTGPLHIGYVDFQRQAD